MKRLKIAAFALSLISLLSCVNSKDVSFGTDLTGGGWIESGAKGKRNQDLSTSFVIYYGCISGFSERWSDEFSKEMPDNGIFALKVEITDESKEKSFYQEYLTFPDLTTNENKYKVRTKNVEGVMDASIPVFTYSTKKSFDFTPINISSGWLSFLHVYYNTQAKEEFKDLLFPFQMNSYKSSFWFEKNDNSVSFKDELERHQEVQDFSKG